MSFKNHEKNGHRQDLNLAINLHNIACFHPTRSMWRNRSVHLRPIYLIRRQIRGPFVFTANTCIYFSGAQEQYIKGLGMWWQQLKRPHECFILQEYIQMKQGQEGCTPAENARAEELWTRTACTLLLFAHSSRYFLYSSVISVVQRGRLEFAPHHLVPTNVGLVYRWMQGIDTQYQ